MRTSFNFDDEQYRRLKAYAARHGKTMSEVVFDALGRVLVPPETPPPQFRFRWKTVRGRLLAGVDINDRDSLYERMER